MNLRIFGKVFMYGLLSGLLGSGLLLQAAHAEYRDPTTRVNNNEQTDLFEKSTGGYGALHRQIEEQKGVGLRGVESSAGLDFIVKENSQEIEQQAALLSDIKATDLNGKGTEEMVKQKVLDEIYVDYSRPLNKQHLIDAEIFAKGQDELMDTLLTKLKEFGVDCKTEKGPIEQEPTYYLKMKQTPIKNTIYNKTICEELRNKYNCQNTLVVKCSKKSSGEAKFATINIPNNEMPSSWWFGGSNGGVGFGIDLSSLIVSFNNESLPELKAKIIEKIGIDEIEVPPQKIMIFGQQQLFYEFDSQGKRGHIQGFWHPNVGLTGSIRFLYVVAQEAECQQWSEEWTERCRLQ